MILLIDNYDSFTFNLYQLLRELGAECEVRRNDAITIDEIRAMRPEKIVISPGPGRPEDAGVSSDVIRTFAPTIPILGVCLGHQAIGLVLGGKVVRARVPMHGKCSRIKHDGRGVFSGLTSVAKGSAKSSAKGAKRGSKTGKMSGNMPGSIQVARYHSLVVERESLPDCLKITAETADGEIMGLRHREWPLEGVQFHPESIATEGGRELLRNFLCA